jgi:hypothetical protein
MKSKTTRKRMISCFAQIINGYVLGYKIPELVKHEKIKARKLSYDSQVYLLMLGQFLHVFSLNELVDISKFLSYIPYSFRKLFIKKRPVFKRVLIAQHSLPHEHD